MSQKNREENSAIFLLKGGGVINSKWTVVTKHLIRRGGFWRPEIFPFLRTKPPAGRKPWNFRDPETPIRENASNSFKNMESVTGSIISPDRKSINIYIIMTLYFRNLATPYFPQQIGIFECRRMIASLFYALKIGNTGLSELFDEQNTH